MWYVYTSIYTSCVSIHICIEVGKTTNIKSRLEIIVWQ